MLRVRLDPGLPGGRWACVQTLCGHDEQSLAHEGGATVAVELLERLLVDMPGTSVGPGQAWELPVSDRDRLLAAVYAATFGDRIESVVPCERCEEDSELGFSLAALVASQTPDAAALTQQGTSGPDESGIYALADGTRFRLPSSADQRALLADPPDRRRVALLRRCILGSDRAETASDISGEHLDRVEAAMELVGPTIDRTLSVDCHECGASREVRFDIQHYLLCALGHERRFLIREIHYLASTYTWSLDEILSLSREDRRAYVGLIASERSARHRSANR